MTNSNIYPVLKRLKNGVLLPYNIRRIYDDDGVEMWEYEELFLRQHTLPSVVECRRLILHALKTELQTYIYGKYDQGEQATIQAYAQKAGRLARNDILDACARVFDWVQKLLDYYGQRKHDVLTSAEPSRVTWDFQQWDDASLPTWQQIRELFEN